ncbi:MAG: pentapeptide repeat-containing protein, partial [Phormidium sp. BM_Day4_Bin.17]|nr:pentapeptide repeat-containing protein [Phormidium sp. BM_Day4_Bin.17]
MTRKPSNSTWLDSVEGLSLVGAVLGTVAGLAFQQLIYVSAPLALALVMNFVNRQRHEEELERSLGDRVVETRLEVERQFEDELSRVREEASLTPEEEPTTTNEDLLAVQEQLQQLQVQSQQPMVAVEELQQQISTLSTQVARALANLENLGTGVATGMLQGVVTASQEKAETDKSQSLAEDVASPEAFWQQYQQGVRQFAGVNLPQVDFSQRREYLDGTDFSQANLQEANLMGLNLGEATLKEANLDGAQLDYGNLSRAQLQNASLVGAHLRGANLRRADLRGANLENADLSYADVTDANFEG